MVTRPSADQFWLPVPGSKTNPHANRPVDRALPSGFYRLRLHPHRRKVGRGAYFASETQMSSRSFRA